MNRQKAHCGLDFACVGLGCRGSIAQSLPISYYPCCAVRFVLYYHMLGVAVHLGLTWVRPCYVLQCMGLLDMFVPCCELWCAVAQGALTCTILWVICTLMYISCTFALMCSCAHCAVPVHSCALLCTLYALCIPGHCFARVHVCAF